MPTLSPVLITALEKLAAREDFVAKSYLAMAYWCDVHHWGGYAQFFHGQADEERGHMQKFHRYLVDRDVVPALLGQDAPKHTFRDLLEIAQAAYAIERENTAGIHAAYELALAEKDYATQVFLQAFIAEQVEEEAWSDKLLEKTRQATCGGAIFNLDRHLTKELRGESAGD